MNVHTKCMVRLKGSTLKWKHRFGAMTVEGHILIKLVSQLYGWLLTFCWQKKDCFNYVREVFQRQPDNNIMD